jgi:hypothetical protein
MVEERGELQRTDRARNQVHEVQAGVGELPLQGDNKPPNAAAQDKCEHCAQVAPCSGHDA